MKDRCFSIVARLSIRPNQLRCTLQVTRTNTLFHAGWEPFACVIVNQSLISLSTTRYFLKNLPYEISYNDGNNDYCSYNGSNDYDDVSDRRSVVTLIVRFRL